MEILDGGNGTAAPIVLDTWELYGCYLTSANYGTLDYSQSAPVQVELSIQYDNAVQTPQGSGVGAPVPRNVSSLTTGGGI